ncbi:hypothetical protein, partial [Paenibacillus phytohabitans]
VNLIVPYIPKEDEKKLNLDFPWESLQLMNSYFFARLTWGDNFEEIEADFYSIFEEHQIKAKQSIEKLESVLSEVSKWNVPLFPYRVIDPERVDQHEELSVIITDLTNWKRELEPLKVDSRSDIDNPNSLITFYSYYVCEKLENYLHTWRGKV